MMTYLFMFVYIVIILLLMVLEIYSIYEYMTCTNYDNKVYYHNLYLFMINCVYLNNCVKFI